MGSSVSRRFPISNKQCRSSQLRKDGDALLCDDALLIAATETAQPPPLKVKNSVNAAEDISTAVDQRGDAAVLPVDVDSAGLPPADTTTTFVADISDATVGVADPTQQQKSRQEHNGSGGHGGSDADRTTEEGLFHVMVPAFSPLLPTAGDTTNSVHLPGDDAPLPPPPSGNADVVARDAAPLALPTMVSSSLMKLFATSVTSNEEGLHASRESNLDATTEHQNAVAPPLSPERRRMTSITTLASAATATMSGSRSFIHNQPLGDAFGNSKTDIPSSTLDGRGSSSCPPPRRRLSEYLAGSHNSASMCDSMAATQSISGAVADPRLVMTAFDTTSWVDAATTTTTTEDTSRLFAETQCMAH